eukprot:scaffold35212_cov101-Isochrysis_galbana.AAC.2
MSKTKSERGGAAPVPAMGCSYLPSTNRPRGERSMSVGGGRLASQEPRPAPSAWPALPHHLFSHAWPDYTTSLCGRRAPQRGVVPGRTGGAHRPSGSPTGRSGHRTRDDQAALLITGRGQTEEGGRPYAVGRGAQSSRVCGDAGVGIRGA